MNDEQKALRALADEWDADTEGREHTEGYERGVLFTFAKCASQLRAILATPTPAAREPVGAVDDAMERRAQQAYLAVGTCTTVCRRGMRAALTAAITHKDTP